MSSLRSTWHRRTWRLLRTWRRSIWQHRRWRRPRTWQHRRTWQRRRRHHTWQRRGRHHTGQRRMPLRNTRRRHMADRAKRSMPVVRSQVSPAPRSSLRPIQRFQYGFAQFVRRRRPGSQWNAPEQAQRYDRARGFATDNYNPRLQHLQLALQVPAMPSRTTAQKKRAGSLIVGMHQASSSFDPDFDTS